MSFRVSSKNLEIHQRAVRRGKLYLQCEADLIESIQEVELNKVYLDHKCRSLHVYVSQVMGLGDAVASNFIAVARKAKEVPALKEVIRSGQLQVQKARKIAPVLDQENQDFWIQLAIEKPQRVVEKEVAKLRPELARPERVKYLTDTRLNVSVNLSEDTYQLLKRVQDLESQRLNKAASLEESFEAAMKVYLQKNDPLEKAKRAQLRRAKSAELRKLKSDDQKKTDNQMVTRVARHATEVSERISKPAKRRPRPTELEHLRQARDQGQCTHKDEYGNRCAERRWLQGHHIIPVSEGGPDSLENLTTLCFGHHRLIHHAGHLSDQVRVYVTGLR